LALKGASNLGALPSTNLPRLGGMPLCSTGGTVRKLSALFEIARVLVPFDHVASRIVNANHSIV